MARRNAADMQKAKEAKQKKLLLLLLPLFLGLVVWQGPKMYKSLFAQPAPEATSVATTASSTVPGTPPTAPAAAPAGALSDSEPLPTARSDQLLSFSRFTARNPFVAPGGATPPPSGASQLTNTAVIEVNGQSEEVVYGATFPTADPVFRLANVTESGIEVGLANGSFDDGRQTAAISIGEQVQLVGDDGTSYTVRLVSVDFKVPCVPGGSAEDCIGSS
ncbi:MAG TPA: hypothetical protein VFH69_02650 [Gemmatimonadota bacterium]|jgi:hypothetical protein|nr:hypothetical protein [Gemmatimonadota bacterium]